MNVWLVITNPYAYDKAMWRAISEAQHWNTGLKVVFLISRDSMSNMMHQLGEMGWLGSASLQSLQISMLEGYRALADDVLKRVERKAKEVELIIEGLVEKPSLTQYVHRIVAQGAIKVIIAGSKSFTSSVDSLPDTVEYIEED
ncbi:MAG: hypothetical protein F6K10_25185 [Moorea sp. SIO2B7]|nr:hypothetical protein [Moorena sp. SIO2B7]